MSDANKAPIAAGIVLFGITVALVVFGLRSGAKWTFDTGDDSPVLREPVDFGKSPAPRGWGSDDLAASRGGFDKGPLDMLLGSFIEGLLSAKSPVVGEALLRFKSDEAYQRFLDQAKKLGLDVKGQIAALRSVRVGAENFAALRDGLKGFADDLGDVTPNTTLSIPTLPIDRAPANRSTSAAPASFELASLAEFLGIPATQPGTRPLGTGASVAVIDSGIDLSVPIFEDKFIRFSDLIDRENSKPVDTYKDGHGTPVAGLIAELAPGTDFDIYRVVAEDGTTDAFTIAEAILLAVERKPTAINISLGGPDANAVLRDAVDQALAAGIPLVIATGNEGQNGPSYPAAFPGVYGATSVDANYQVLDFSNQLLEDGLGIAAPGYGVPIYGRDGVELLGSGTSFSSPIATATGLIIAREFNIPAAEAFTIVSGFSVDRGAPGPDPDYGFGTPDLQAAFWQFDATAHNDLVIGSHYITTDENGNRQLQAPVQNLGNRAVPDFSVEIFTDGRTNQVTLPGLQPGEGTSITVPLPEGTGTVGTLARQPGTAQDARADNNGIQSTLR